MFLARIHMCNKHIPTYSANFIIENTTTTLGEKPYEGIGLGDTMLQNNNYSPKIQQILAINCPC
jgi:hypothetical protein